MSYEVLARKYRPQQFDQVVGQAHVRQTLKNAIETNRVAHAYLFVGPRGVGKTSIARILAKALNCEKGPTTTPCDECDSCKEINKGSNLDVLEIDAASNTGVENVRDLRENVRYAPSRGRSKVYIIDEVHMLSIGAFNALLKTLEEPPSHVVFILATTDPQKVPATIMSRCQRFDLRRITTRDIVTHLRMIAAKEAIDIDDDALLAIARGAEGGLRDAESALDQLTAFRGKTIREADVLSVFGLVSYKSLEQLADATLKGDIGRITNLIADLDGAGKDLQRLSVELLEYFRNLMVMLYGGAINADLDLADAQIESLKAQADSTEAGRVARVVDILIEVQGHLRYSLSRRTVLEIALIRAARTAVAVSLDEVLDKLNELKARLGGDTLPFSQEEATPAGERQRSLSQVKEAPAVVSPTPPGQAPSERDELALLTQQWQEIIEKVGHLAALAKNYLRDARPTSVSGSRVMIGFDPEFASHIGKIEVPRNITAIQRVLGDVLGRSIGVAFHILEPGQVRSSIAASPRVESEVRPIEQKSKPSQTATPKSKQHWMNDPAVKRALETFNGDIVDIR